MFFESADNNQQSRKSEAPSDGADNRFETRDLLHASSYLSGLAREAKSGTNDAACTELNSLVQYMMTQMTREYRDQVIQATKVVDEDALKSLPLVVVDKDGHMHRRAQSAESAAGDVANTLIEKYDQYNIAALDDRSYFFVEPLMAAFRNNGACGTQKFVTHVNEALAKRNAQFELRLRQEPESLVVELNSKNGNSSSTFIKLPH